MIAATYELSQLVRALSVTPIQVQSVLDNAWARQADDWSALRQSFASESAASDSTQFVPLLVSAPIRQVIHRFELDCRVRLRVTHGRRFAVQAEPLNLGWEKTFGSCEDSAGRMCLTIEAVPLTTAPSATAHTAVDDFPLKP